jgi:hypothetical protein
LGKLLEEATEVRGKGLEDRFGRKETIFEERRQFLEIGEKHTL